MLNELRQQVSSGLLLRFSPALLTKGQCHIVQAWMAVPMPHPHFNQNAGLQGSDTI